MDDKDVCFLRWPFARLGSLFSVMHFVLKDGKYREALGRWETALTFMPAKAVLHEQKAQVLLEIGDAWNALKAATRELKSLFCFMFDFSNRDLFLVYTD